MTAPHGAASGTEASGTSDSTIGRTAPNGAALAPPAPSSGRLAAPQVQAMFDRIAGVYDLLNTAMSAGLHHRWRARAADLARVGPGAHVLDVATGTGDLAIELARRVAPDGEVVGCDFAEAMLARARAKGARLEAGAVRPRFEHGDALALPYASDSFDAATVGFGARNLADLQVGLQEMARVVRPGGRVVVLEITTPAKGPLSLFYGLWFDRLVPSLGRLAGAFARPRGREAPGSQRRSRSGRQQGHLAGPQVTVADAYAYLPSSVKRFPAPVLLAAEMERAGLREISYLLTAGGIVAIHVGTVPQPGAPARPDGRGREQA